MFSAAAMLKQRRLFLSEYLENIENFDRLFLNPDDENLSGDISATNGQIVMDDVEPIVEQLKRLLYHMELLKNRAAKIHRDYSALKKEYNLKVKENENLRAEITEQKIDKRNLLEENKRLKDQLNNLLKCQTLDAANLLDSAGYMAKDYDLFT